MPNPRYVPHDFLVDRSLFGTDADVTWVDSSGLTGPELDCLGAAQLQHIWAVDVGRRIREQFGTQIKYSLAAGESPQRLNRLLNGAIIARLEDVARMRRFLGTIVP